MAHDVFISHSTKDKLTADAICSIFENNGIRCWIAPRDIVPGMEWVDSIIDGISASRIMVLVLSSNSNASPQVKREVEQAVNQDVIVIPFRIEEVELSKSFKYYLSGTHWLDALTTPMESHIKNLLETVKRLLPALEVSPAQEKKAKEQLEREKEAQEKLVREKAAEEKKAQEQLEREKVAQKQNLSDVREKTELPRNWKKYLFRAVVIVMAMVIAFRFHQYNIEKNSPAKQVTSAFEPEMVAITGGCFQMGSPKKEKDRNSDEKQHQVCVKDFQIGKYEVTQEQWQAVMGNNPSIFKGENLPVEEVSWNDVQTFLEKLNAKTGKNYRLPTEAEWEYAARAGTTTPFYTGQVITDKQANINGVKTTAIGYYPANPWGLYDMVGNVWEWTCSAYSENYDGSELKCSSTTTSSELVMRGGSWSYYGRYARSAARGRYEADSRGNARGFRFALGLQAR